LKFFNFGSDKKTDLPDYCETKMSSKIESHFSRFIFRQV